MLDGPTMPIIGEGDEEANDRYVEQLTMSARAAVKAVVDKASAAERGRMHGGRDGWGCADATHAVVNGDHRMLCNHALSPARLLL